MSRRCAEPIEVERRDDAPGQFLWRGRLFVVRDVLAHWLEAGAWWRARGATALVTGDALAGPPVLGAEERLAPIPASPKWAERAWGEPAPDVGAAVGPVGLDDGEREYWRVEASAGRAAGTGVYDLCLDWSAGGWTVARVLD